MIWHGLEEVNTVHTAPSVISGLETRVSNVSGLLFRDLHPHVLGAFGQMEAFFDAGKRAVLPHLQGRGLKTLGLQKLPFSPF